MGDRLDLYYRVCIDQDIESGKLEKNYFVFEYKRGGDVYKSLAEIAGELCRRLYVGAEDGNPVWQSVTLHAGSGLGEVPHGATLIAKRHGNIQVSGPDSESISDFRIIQSKLVRLIREANKRIHPYVC